MHCHRKGHMKKYCLAWQQQNKKKFNEKNFEANNKGKGNVEIDQINVVDLEIILETQLPSYV